ncbi:MAG: endolytic transglycosylase MltG [Armatimonadota bacterium]
MRRSARSPARTTRRPARSWLWRLTLFMMALLTGAALGMVWWTWRSLQPIANHGERVIFEVEEGQNLRQIARELQGAGLISNARVFCWGVERWGLAEQLKHGHYELAPSMSPRAIAEKIARGEVVVRKVTIPEGFTIDQIAARLEAEEVCEAESFAKLARYESFDELMGMERPKSGWEGYLFPKTYTMPYRAKARVAITMLLEQFLAEIEPLRPAIEQGKLGLHGVVTLASLVEREARLDEERPVIASVYYNRLDRGMKLQCDATVVYAWARRGVQKTRLLYSDLTIDSPYNTYMHPGLPVGPIASPGLKSLEAAVHPDTTDYLYYVARGDGSHVFTKTEAQHEAAKRRVRAGRG